eukprot:COSAG02_NODE_33265_length_503_cov_0.497525_1_plen_84_part_00
MADVVAPSTPNTTAVPNAGEQVEQENFPRPEAEDSGSRRNARETAEALVRLLANDTRPPILCDVDMQLRARQTAHRIEVVLED